MGRNTSTNSLAMSVSGASDPAHAGSDVEPAATAAFSVAATCGVSRHA